MQAMGFIQHATPATQTRTIQEALVPARFTHAHAIGQTGCSKTTSFIYPNLDHRIALGHSVIVYDFKGKEHLALKHFARKNGRLNDVVELGKPWGENINIIRMMDRKGIEGFIKKMVGFTAENLFWSDSAAKLFLSVYDAVVTLEKLGLAFEKLGIAYTSDELRNSELYYPTSLSFKNVYQVCSDEKLIYYFVNGLRDLFYTTRQKIDGLIEKTYLKHFNHRLIYQDFKHLHRLLLEFERNTNDAERTLALFNTDEFGQTTKIGIIITLMPLADIAAKAELNQEGSDLIQMLGDGKLISINCKDMPDELIEAVGEALFSNLAKRSMMIDAHPVSIFIDEAQRVLTKEQDIGLDILRECRVELFLAYQNEELMHSKLGVEEYQAMAKNLSTAYYYKNPSEHKDNDLGELQSYECFSSTDNYASKQMMSPIHVDKSAFYAAEHAYQILHDVHARYGLEQHRATTFCIYEARLFDNHQMLLFDIEKNMTLMDDFIDAQTNRDILLRVRQECKQLLSTHRFLHGSKSKAKQTQTNEDEVIPEWEEEEYRDEWDPYECHDDFDEYEDDEEEYWEEKADEAGEYLRQKAAEKLISLLEENTDPQEEQAECSDEGLGEDVCYNDDDQVAS